MFPASGLLSVQLPHSLLEVAALGGGKSVQSFTLLIAVKLGLFYL